MGLAASVLILLYVLWAQPSALGDTLSGMFTQPLLLLLNWAAHSPALRGSGLRSGEPNVRCGRRGAHNGRDVAHKPGEDHDAERTLRAEGHSAGERGGRRHGQLRPEPALGAGGRASAAHTAVRGGGHTSAAQKAGKEARPRPAAACLLCLLLLVGLVAFVYSSDAVYESFETEKPYDSCAVADELGFPYYFCYHFSTMSVAKPEGFDRAEAESWEQDYEAPEDAAELNVVFVMNEAFSDILNEDVFVFPEGEHPMSVYNKLAAGENAYAGHIVIPYFGGGTADTEFDVATGMQTNLLNPNSPSLTAFRCVERPMESLYRVFGSEGYTTSFMHPGDGWFYGRDEVYELLGSAGDIFCGRYGGP